MLFCIVGEDIANSTPLRQQVRQDHLARLAQLQAENRLILAGPFPQLPQGEQMTGSLIVAQFDSQEAAEQWAAEDPYQHAGVYAKVSIKPFKQVFPEQN